jgi:hypothetical protein
VQPQPDLLEVVGARRPRRRLAGLLHRRQEQADQHPDDSEDGHQFDQPRVPGARGRRPIPGAGHAHAIVNVVAIVALYRPLLSSACAKTV